MHSSFVSRAVWETCAGEAEEDVFLSNPVYVGLDLSARNDLTALVMTAQSGGVWHIRSTFFAPEFGLRERSQRDRAPYDVWANEGHIITTPGASINYETIARELQKINERYMVARVSFDRWRIDVLQAELSRLNVDIPLIPFGQGYKDMAPALDTAEALLVDGAIRHGGHPVLRMCAANCVVVRDPAGNRKLDKSRGTGRIDGMVAMVMALGTAAKHENTDNIDAILSNVVRA